MLKFKTENGLMPNTWNFETVIVKTFNTVTESKQYEIELIDLGKKQFGDLCVNIQPGGDGGIDKHTYESKLKMSNSRTGITRKPFSAGHKLNLSAKKRKSPVWHEPLKTQLFKYWIEFGKPKRGKFTTLLKPLGYNYKPNDFTRLIEHFEGNSDV